MVMTITVFGCTNYCCWMAAGPIPAALSSPSRSAGHLQPFGWPTSAVKCHGRSSASHFAASGRYTSSRRQLGAAKTAPAEHSVFGWVKGTFCIGKCIIGARSTWRFLGQMRQSATSRGCLDLLMNTLSCYSVVRLDNTSAQHY